MRKYQPLYVIMFLLCSSCAMQAQKQPEDRLIFSGVFVANSSFIFQNSRVSVIENLGMSRVDGRNVSYLQWNYRMNNSDSLVVESSAYLDEGQFGRVLRPDTAQRLLIKNISGFSFRYDPPPAEHLKISGGKILHFKRAGVVDVILSDSSSTYKLHVGKKGADDVVIRLRNYQPYTPEFFLVDVVGDSIPEIVVLAFGYASGRDIVYIDIYKLP